MRIKVQVRSIVHWKNGLWPFFGHQLRLRRQSERAAPAQQAWFLRGRPSPAAQQDQRKPRLMHALNALMFGTLLLASGGAFAAESEAGAEASSQTNWKAWHADIDIANRDALQRGARNFANYCLGCHSLKYERYSRLGQDLAIPPDLLNKYLVPPGDKDTNYILTSMPAADAEAWFGKTPPDLSLMARARGTEYLYRFLKTFYVDPTRQTGANNLQLPSTAMPHVLSELEGLKKPVYKSVEKKNEDGETTTEQVFDHFEQVAPGRMNAEEYDSFVRDTVAFLSYVGEPAQIQRHSLGIWVVLFLLVFTWLAWLMKKEYWKDVR